MRATRSRRGVSWDQKANRQVLARRLITGTAATLTLLSMTGAANAAPAEPHGHIDPGKLAAQAGPNDGPQQDVIVTTDDQKSAADLADAVLPPGQEKKALFESINGFEAHLNQHWIDALTAAGASVTPNAPVLLTGTANSTNSTSSTPGSATCPGPTDPSTPTGQFVSDTGADRLATAGDTGQGTTVAVLDTGVNGNLPDFQGRLVGGVDLSGGNSPYTDQYGHGTFVAGLIAGNGASSNGQYTGEAPGANLVSIKVAGATGATTISTVIQGIDWAMKNQKKLGIDVLNLSLGAIPTGPTATEPLDQAVESAWYSGLVVTVAAGNSGPFNGTILSPADDPLVITTGAFADNNSNSPTNWAACPFSSVGPTAFDGWLKPDVVAPGRSVVSLLDPGSTIALANPQAVVNQANFVGSGTSFASAITAGAAALVLTDHPSATPNEVKGRLLGNAMPGELGNPMVEGHGFLNAYAAATGPQMVLNQNSAAKAESWTVPATVSFSSAWLVSSWNPNNWTGSSWTGSSWTGSSWTGSSWTGSSWTGGAWNGSSWTGSSWNGSSWTGSSWTGSSWTGSSWTGKVWDGSSWTGSSWTGSSWTGSSWTGSSWTGSSWTGSSWTGSSWTGSSWTSDMFA